MPAKLIHFFRIQNFSAGIRHGGIILATGINSEKSSNIAMRNNSFMKRLSFTVFPFLCTLLLAGCQHSADLSIAPPFPSQSPWMKCSKDTIYFQNSVLPVVINSCAKPDCHDAGGHKHGLTLNSYQNIYNLVTPGDPVSSKLYIVLFSNSEARMPPNSRLTVNQEGLIYYWILRLIPCHLRFRHRFHHSIVVYHLSRRFGPC